MIDYEEYPIGTIVAYDTVANSRREGVIVGYSVNDVNEDVFMVCWSDGYKVSKTHPSNVYKI